MSYMTISKLTCHIKEAFLAKPYIFLVYISHHMYRLQDILSLCLDSKGLGQLHCQKGLFLATIQTRFKSHFAPVT